MKKIILSTFALFSIALGVQAQSGVDFQVRAGANFNTINTDPDSDNKIKPGFHVGVDVGLPIAEEFYIQPGVLFSMKGAKYDAANTSVSLNYIEVPVSFMYKGALGQGRFLLGVGPYVGFGLSGKNKNDIADFDIDFGDADNELKRLDFGGNITAGYEFSNRFLAQLNFQLGMSDMSNVDAVKQKNTGFGVSVGYRF